MSHTIQPCGLGDVKTITDIIRKSFSDVAERFHLTLDNCPKHPSNCRPEWIAEAMNKGVMFFRLMEEDTATGCVGLERANERVCYLERLAVPPEFRKKGRGEALTRFALAKASEIGAGRVEIGIIAAQTELADWYSKLGFRPIRTARFDHLPFEVAFMGLDL